MRISDWSSDVCSSDLALRQRQALDTLCFPPDWVCWLDAGQASERVGMPLPSGGLWFAKGQRVQPEPLLEALLKLRSEEHTSELQSLMRISYAVFCLKKKRTTNSRATHNKQTFMQTPNITAVVHHRN